MQELRQLYRPQQLNLLFIGESPPAGETFFYAGNSLLFTYTRKAFSQALNYQWEDAGGFLNYFRSSGCYLEDLCLNPINNLIGAARIAEHHLGIAPLVNRLEIWENPPHLIVTIGRSIQNSVQSSVEQRSWNEIPNYILPFAGNGHQNTYVAMLREIVESALDEGWIDDPIMG